VRYRRKTFTFAISSPDEFLSHYTHLASYVLVKRVK